MKKYVARTTSSRPSFVVPSLGRTFQNMNSSAGLICNETTPSDVFPSVAFYTVCNVCEKARSRLVVPGCIQGTIRGQSV